MMKGTSLAINCTLTVSTPALVGAFLFASRTSNVNVVFGVLLLRSYLQETHMKTTVQQRCVSTLATTLISCCTPPLNPSRTTNLRAFQAEP